VGAKKEQEVYEAVSNIQKLLEEQDLIFYPQP
jgi:TATA-box binding protein (TBP) (component of TFIID and TFIIIB)